MPIFKYRAINERGETVRGLVEANTVDDISELLGERKLTIVSLSESSGKGITISLPFFGKVKKKSVVIFSRQLAVMIAATVPVVQALRILIVQTEDKKLKEVIAEMGNDVDGGMKMSSAFAKHPEVFSQFYVAMLRSGETSGRLEKVLNYLAAQMEKDYDLTNRIRGAMVYPIFILTAMVAVGVLMLIFVVPRMTELLQETGSELPFMTMLLINVSGFLVGYWWTLILLVVFLVVIFRLVLRTRLGREKWDYYKLRVPVFGVLMKKIILSRLATGLSTLIKGGVPISRGLSITSEIVSNESFKVMIEETVKEVEDGNSITTVFARNRLAPTMVAHMLSAGERPRAADEGRG